MDFELQPHTIEEDLPLIYMWEIRDTTGALVGRYVGKSKRGSRRPLNHYTRNVANILQGRPYRKGNATGFRRIHRALAQAEQRGFHVTLKFLCNVGPEEDINRIEQACIHLHNSCGSESWQLNG